MKEIIAPIIAVAVLIGGLIGGVIGNQAGSGATKFAIAADLAERGYTLQRVETVGEGARWMVVEVGE